MTGILLFHHRVNSGELQQNQESSMIVILPDEPIRAFNTADSILGYQENQLNRQNREIHELTVRGVMPIPVAKTNGVSIGNIIFDDDLISV